MNLFSVLLLSSAIVVALSLPNANQITLADKKEVELYLIELGPGLTRHVTEDEKWALRRVSFISTMSGLGITNGCFRKGLTLWTSQMERLEDPYARRRRPQ